MPITVIELITLLSSLPPDSAVHAAIVGITGWYPDVDHAQIDTVDVYLDTAGQVRDVWLVGSTPGAAPPAIITITCPCNQRIIVDDTLPWPPPHLACRYHPNPAR